MLNHAMMINRSCGYVANTNDPSLMMRQSFVMCSAAKGTPLFVVTARNGVPD